MLRYHHIPEEVSIFYVVVPQVLFGCLLLEVYSLMIRFVCAFQNLS